MRAINEAAKLLWPSITIWAFGVLVYAIYGRAEEVLGHGSGKGQDFRAFLFLLYHFLGRVGVLLCFLGLGVIVLLIKIKRRQMQR